MVWATLNPEPTETAANEAPNAAAYSPMPTEARTILPRSLAKINTLLLR
jgi:hypothetical protein